MVQLFKSKQGNTRKSSAGNLYSGKGHVGRDRHSTEVVIVKIDDMDHQGKGVVRGGKVTFVDGAISKEVCKINIIKQQKGIRHARVLEVIEAAPQRQIPFCPHFQQCGGCQTQHIRHDWLITEKQQAIGTSLQKALTKTGFAGSIPWQSAIVSSEKGYRRKARLAVDARNSDNIKLGFRDEKNQVFSLSECKVLEPELQYLIVPLQDLMKKLKAVKALGHITLFNGHVFSGDGAKPSLLVSFRFTKDLPAGDLVQLQEFSKVNSVLVQLQIKDAATQNLVLKDSADISAQLPGYVLNGMPCSPGKVNSTEENSGRENPIEIALNPNDFVQINRGVNQQMILRTIKWLELEQEDRVLDLFCGVGNFSLALARQCQQVVGFEGVPEMVQNATVNAQRNGINNVSFLSGDLTDENFLRVLRQQNCNKVVLDPARAGALKVMASLRYLAPEAIVYVSCNPATFGRDIAELLEKRGERIYKNHYRLEKLSLVDMFPNTSHSEIMGLFKLHS